MEINIKDLTVLNGGTWLWLITQVTLLVLYYGNIFSSLPWWVVWFPSLIILGIFAICIIVFINMFLYVWL